MGSKEFSKTRMAHSTNILVCTVGGEGQGLNTGEHQYLTTDIGFQPTRQDVTLTGGSDVHRLEEKEKKTQDRWRATDPV